MIEHRFLPALRGLRQRRLEAVQRAIATGRGWYKVFMQVTIL